MLRFIALRGVHAHENVEHSQRWENVIHRDLGRIVELLSTIGQQTTNHAK